ncbi:hypothetical protein PV343_01695 [Streptomyces sp. WI03-4A]|nr:hypothetical protein [Streptomyces sp. WI03-4A]MDX2591037.1 hypothetical protein [Streptomyces sp. WI03-4A]
MTERACDLSHTLQQVLVLNTNDLVASQRLDLLNGIAPPHHIDRAQTQVPGQLNDEPADGGARRGLQQPCSRLDVELTSRQEQRGQRVDRELTGSGVAQTIGDRQKPVCIGNKVFLPGAGYTRPGYGRDGKGHYTLADLQSLGVRTQGLNTAHAFHVPACSRKLGGETVATTQHVQIAGVSRRRLHTDQRLAGFRRGNRPGFQAQDIVRLADLSGYERAHGLRHEWPFVSQHPTKSANVLGRNDATSGESRRHVCSLT